MVRWILIAVLASSLAGVGVAFASSLSVSSARVTVFTNTLASPTVTTSLTASTIPVTSSAGAIATLSGTAGTPSGSMTFTYYPTSNCSGPPVAPPDVVSVTGLVTNSTPVTFTTAGSYYWKSAYSGDGYNQPAAHCLGTPLVVTP